MALRRPLLLVLLAAITSMGASYRTANFIIEAPTPQLAQQAGQYAEHYRKEKALQWLGEEMQQWPEPCPVRLTVTNSGAGGATSFAFDRGRVLGQQMHIEGTTERLLNSVLPHEVTHTVFAYKFRQPVPRWADEGGAVLSEDDIERNRHDMLAWQILNTPGRLIPLRRLFALKEYPGDVMALYAEGYSVSNFLVSTSNRPVFLSFVAQGMREGWDRAAQSHYHYNSVEELEQAWITSLKNSRRQPAQLANNNRPAEVAPARRELVRTTVPPMQPFEEGTRPVYRGQAEDEAWNQQPQRASTTRPGYLPEYNSPSRPAPQVVLQQPPQDRWQPATITPLSPNAVQLGPPDVAPPPGSVSPAGYPR
jgi:hypothetical protein